MYFPKFWARASEPARGTAGRSLRVSCWRWSDQSLADAQEMARQAARQLADRFARGMIAKARYGYGDRPFREPVIRDMRDESNELTAVLSRNSYGCLVLNTSRVMFVDVDIPQLESAVPGWLRKLTRKPAPESLVEQALGRADQWCRRTPGWGWRVYRTRAGLRLLATHGLFEPESEFTQSAFDAVNADPLYRKLCQTQKCFRARVTPKPWRCDVGIPPVRWPFADGGAEARFQSWVSSYEVAAKDRATCELVTCIGNTAQHPGVQAIVRLHDELSRVGSGLQLA